MNLLGTSPSIVFDRRYPAEYRIASYVSEMARRMTDPFDEFRHVGVTDFFFGARPAWGPLPFRSDVLDVDGWRPGLLRAMWGSASDALSAARPGVRWYAEKLAVDEAAFREAGIDVFTIDLVRDPRDVLASRRSFVVAGTEQWTRDAQAFSVEMHGRLDELDRRPANLRLRYEELASDLAASANQLSEHLGVELEWSAVERPEHHVTTPSLGASVGRWQRDLDETEIATLASITQRLGY